TSIERLFRPFISVNRIRALPKNTVESRLKWPSASVCNNCIFLLEFADITNNNTSLSAKGFFVASRVILPDKLIYSGSEYFLACTISFDKPDHLKRVQPLVIITRSSAFCTESFVAEK